MAIIYGFDKPHLELAAAIIVRAVNDAQSGRPCNVERLPCGMNNMAGVHICAWHARQFLASEDAAFMMAALGLNRTAVLEAIGEHP